MGCSRYRYFTYSRVVFENGGTGKRQSKCPIFDQVASCLLLSSAFICPSGMGLPILGIRLRWIWSTLRQGRQEGQRNDGLPWSRENLPHCPLYVDRCHLQLYAFDPCNFILYCCPMWMWSHACGSVWSRTQRYVRICC